jgi:hypothetical protein
MAEGCTTRRGIRPDQRRHGRKSFDRDQEQPPCRSFTRSGPGEFAGCGRCSRRTPAHRCNAKAGRGDPVTRGVAQVEDRCATRRGGSRVRSAAVGQARRTHPWCVNARTTPEHSRLAPKRTVSATRRSGCRPANSPDRRVETGWGQAETSRERTTWHERQRPTRGGPRAGFVDYRGVLDRIESCSRRSLVAGRALDRARAAMREGAERWHPGPVVTLRRRRRRCCGPAWRPGSADESDELNVRVGGNSASVVCGISRGSRAKRRLSAAPAR